MVMSVQHQLMHECSDLIDTLSEKINTEIRRGLAELRLQVARTDSREIETVTRLNATIQMYEHALQNITTTIERLHRYRNLLSEEDEEQLHQRLEVIAHDVERIKQAYFPPLAQKQEYAHDQQTIAVLRDILTRLNNGLKALHEQASPARKKWQNTCLTEFNQMKKNLDDLDAYASKGGEVHRELIALQTQLTTTITTALASLHGPLFSPACANVLKAAQQDVIMIQQPQKNPRLR